MTAEPAGGQEPSSLRRIVRWIEVAVLWGLSGVSGVHFLSFAFNNTPIPRGFLVLCATAFFTEFFLVHSGAMVGSILAGRKVSVAGRWGCGGALMLFYAAFIVPLSLAIKYGWGVAVAVLFQMIRHAIHWGDRGGMSKDRMLVGFALLFGPFLIGGVLGLPVSILTDVFSRSAEEGMSPEEATWLSIFYFALAGWFATPWHERWRDGVIRRRREAKAAERAKLVAKLRDPDARVRLAALDSLRGAAIPDPPEEVIAALEDPDPAFRLAAVRLFGWRHPRAAPKIIKLIDDPVEEVAERAAESLCRMNTEEETKHAEKYYLEGANPRVAYACGRGLHGLLRRESIPAGLQRFRDLLGEADPGRRELGVEALGKLGTPDEAALLRARLEDESESVRERAALILRDWERR